MDRIEHIKLTEAVWERYYESDEPLPGKHS